MKYLPHRAPSAKTREQWERAKTIRGSQRLPDLFRNATRTSSERLNAEPAPCPSLTAHPLPEASTASQTTANSPNGGRGPASDRKRRKKDYPELKASIADLENRLQSKTMT